MLAYRALGFALDDVAALIDATAEPLDHPRRQHALVRERIDQLTRRLGSLEKTMEAHMTSSRLTPQERFEVFGEHDPDQYADEVRDRWGDTDSHHTSLQRAAGYGKDDWLRVKAEGDEITQRFAAALAVGLPADGPEARQVARDHREHISRWFYECTPQMQRGLAQMYVEDARFTRTYEDRGPGLARYVRDAILADTARA